MNDSLICDPGPVCGKAQPEIHIEGTKINLLTVLETIRKRTKGRTHILYRCRCDCGNEAMVYRCALVSGSTKSCGCSKVVTIPCGTRFHQLTVQAKVKTRKGFAYECLCDCGGSTTVPGAVLKSGLTKSCGCLLRRPDGTPPGQSGLTMVLALYKANARNHHQDMLLTDAEMADRVRKYQASLKP